MLLARDTVSGIEAGPDYLNPRDCKNVIFTSQQW